MTVRCERVRLRQTEPGSGEEFDGQEGASNQPSRLDPVPRFDGGMLSDGPSVCHGSGQVGSGSGVGGSIPQRQTSSLHGGSGGPMVGSTVGSTVGRGPMVGRGGTVSDGSGGTVMDGEGSSLPGVGDVSGRVVPEGDESGEGEVEMDGDRTMDGEGIGPFSSGGGSMAM